MAVDLTVCCHRPYCGSMKAHCCFVRDTVIRGNGQQHCMHTRLARMLHWLRLGRGGGWTVGSWGKEKREQKVGSDLEGVDQRHMLECAPIFQPLLRYAPAT